MVCDKKISHIGVILDGNRRFAKRLMKQPWKGHEWGSEKIKDFLNWCKEANIRTVTIYSFSVQNFSRPKVEFEFIMKLFEKEFLEMANNKEHPAHRNKVRVKAVGRIWMLPEFVQKAIKKAEKATEKYNNYYLNIAIAYGGQEEIVDATAKIARKVKNGEIDPDEIDTNVIEKMLYVGQPYPDIIIRTGGEKRLSNFLLWQSAYSELFFIDKLWPEIKKEDFFRVLQEFALRERRFGK